MNYVVQDTSLTAVADAIRKQTKSTEQIPFPNGFVSEIGKIDAEGSYNNGYQQGYTEGEAKGDEQGYSRGLAEGQKAEYNKFWDKYQINGNRGSSGSANYRNAFQGAGWNKDTFYPKYDITGDGTAYQCFSSFNNEPTYEPFDLAQRLEDCGVVLDTSQSSFNSGFSYAKVTRLPVIDTRGNNNAYIGGCFAHCYYLVTIDKLIMKDDPSITVASCFDFCHDLENIIIEGVIGQNLNMRHCSKLTDASIQSIIDSLYDWTDGEAKGLTLHANVKAKLTEAQIAQITSKNWTLA